MPNDMKNIFFGNSALSVYVLDELTKAGLAPMKIVTFPDRPEGRKLALTPTPVKVWAQKNNIPVYEPTKLDDSFIAQIKEDGADVFIVASYGKIMPESVLY